jgi:uncharacterized protein (DUF2461 family)
VWPPAALEFLRELEANNDRYWFKANRKRYDEDLLDPAKALAEKLKHLGEPHFFRPYRDTRFRPGPPIKEQLGVAIGYGGGGGFYLELSLDGLLKRAPKGYPGDHPRIDRLRMKHLTLFIRHPLEAWLHTAVCDDRVKTELEAARPYVDWLAETVGPSTPPRRR